MRRVAACSVQSARIVLSGTRMLEESEMETVVGMVLILGGIGGAAGVLVALITALVTAPDLYRSWLE